MTDTCGAIARMTPAIPWCSDIVFAFAFALPLALAFAFPFGDSWDEGKELPPPKFGSRIFVVVGIGAG